MVREEKIKIGENPLRVLPVFFYWRKREQKVCVYMKNNFDLCEVCGRIMIGCLQAN